VAYKTKKGAQDAHEAIRPTSLERPPDSVQGFLNKEELAVYSLIWNRFVASQMTPAVFDQTSVDIEAGDMLFRATGQIMKFDGFIRVYTEGVDDEKSADDDKDRKLPPLSENEILKLLELQPEQHFTQPPPRYSQATLIKELEEQGIGRPSTYASIMSTIIAKEYVSEENKRLYATELGFLVSDLLTESFPDLMNVEFTASMENTLDAIEEGKQQWLDALRNFYGPFSKDLAKAGEHMRDVKREGQPTDIECPKCKAPMVVKWGRAGEFLGCSAYPECKTTTNFKRDEEGNIVPVAEEVIDEVCEKCGSPMKMRFGRYGKFLGCSAYPECKNVRSLNRPVPTGVKCPDCKEGEIMEKKSRGGKIFYSCGRYPDCRFATWERPVPEPCPLCAAPFVVEKTTKRLGTVRRCLSEGCEYKETVEEAEAV
jgi:DNA topoisomerase I